MDGFISPFQVFLNQQRLSMLDFLGQYCFSCYARIRTVSHPLLDPNLAPRLSFQLDSFFWLDGAVLYSKTTICWNENKRPENQTSCFSFSSKIESIGSHCSKSIQLISSIAMSNSLGIDLIWSNETPSPLPICWWRYRILSLVAMATNLIHSSR